jgi:polyhydroxyalkanoate synthesis regulator phasin
MRWPLLFALLLAACSKGPQADLASIGEARSLAAEWALVNDLALKGQVSATYAQTMRQQLRGQLQTTASSLSQPDSTYGREIQALLSDADDADPQELRAHAQRLKSIEDHLESA